MIGMDLFVDFIVAFALISALSMAYRRVQTVNAKETYAELLLGAALGGVALIQMQIPLEPMPGLLIDMRNVPVALCGAFLGWRACLVCLGIAVAARVQIGGIGMVSGVLAMCVAMVMGMIWAGLTNRNRSLKKAKRSSWVFVVLALMVSCHLGAGWVLPEAARSWFYAEAALPLLGLNLTALTCCAALFETERWSAIQQKKLLSSVAYDPDTGLMTKPAFLRDVNLVARTVPADGQLYFVHVELRHIAMRQWLLSRSEQSRSLGLIYSQIREDVPEVLSGCVAGQESLVLAVQATDLEDPDAFATRLRRSVGDRPDLRGAHHLMPPSIEAHVIPWRPGLPLNLVLGEALTAGRSNDIATLLVGVTESETDFERDPFRSHRPIHAPGVVNEFHPSDFGKGRLSGSSALTSGPDTHLENLFGRVEAMLPNHSKPLVRRRSRGRRTGTGT